ncbi:hypothetical protein SAMN02745194_04832 [Roseomonas rosea]|uniref:Uncharacterized protein n=1 Tax=Muricoccus roseus TaxID=198092 RepID=A0A1M6S480_9PROT|nr:tetratricopeptide repeat protein [Roseomonas rosea]SHK39525.1 hypothetical protein SAMN02745194_04832 [Roseomonas rosea]
MDPIYEDEDVRVLGSRFASSRTVVTFSSLNEHERPFGKDFLDRHEVSGVYFVAKWNHWWQPEGCRAGAEAARRYLEVLKPEGVMTYGSSMGGFGAALHSRRLGAETVLMLAPQFSVDPAKPPHETRWKAEASRLRFLQDDLAAEISLTARKIVVYDPMTPDEAQAELFAALPGTELFKTPSAGHAIGHFLLQTKLLQDLVLTALEGRLSWADYRAQVRERRSVSGNYWHQLGRAAQLRRHGYALELLARGAALRPKDVAIQTDYGNALLRAKAYEEALAVFQHAAELVPEAPAPLRGLSLAHRGLGRMQESVVAAEAAVSRRPGSADLQRVLVNALVAAGELERALEVVTATVAAEPGNAENARLRDRILEKLPGPQDIRAAS